MKVCTKCRIPQTLNSFVKNKRSSDGYFHQCKNCTKIYKDSIKEKTTIQNKEWNLKNKEKAKLYNKKYHIDNLLKHNQNIVDWFKNNPTYCKIWKRHKYQNDVNYKIKDNIRSRFYHTLKEGYENPSISILLGCSIEEFKLHLEQQFKPEMTWLNHGEIWEIDHIKPCSSFDLTVLEEQEKCFHFTNHQPLFKTTQIAESYGYINEIGNRNKSNTYNK